MRVAILPSSDMAYFMTTNGRPVFTQVKNSSFWRAQSGQSSTSTSIPAWRRAVSPSTRGLGSRAPTTTRLTPAAMRARVQGGVRP